MPELSRFAGIIIKMLFNDTVQQQAACPCVLWRVSGFRGHRRRTAGGFPACEAVKDGRGLAGPARGRSLCRVEQGRSWREL